MSAAEHQTSEEEFTSYYGLPVVKESPWEVDIPIYIFAGGLASVSSLLAAGGQLTARPALQRAGRLAAAGGLSVDRKSTRLNSSHVAISYAVFCLKKKNTFG